MAKKERIEDLGRISIMIDQTLLSPVFDKKEISSFIQIYSDKKNLEDLFHYLSYVKETLKIISKVADGEW